jgi:hypothetical protein
VPRSSSKEARVQVQANPNHSKAVPDYLIRAWCTVCISCRSVRGPTAAFWFCITISPRHRVSISGTLPAVPSAVGVAVDALSDHRSHRAHAHQRLDPTQSARTTECQSIPIDPNRSQSIPIDPNRSQPIHPERASRRDGRPAAQADAMLNPLLRLRCSRGTCDSSRENDRRKCLCTLLARDCEGTAASQPSGLRLRDQWRLSDQQASHAHTGRDPPGSAGIEWDLEGCGRIKIATYSRGDPVDI